MGVGLLDKFKAMDTKKKTIVFICLAVILGALIFMATLKNVTTMTYPDKCVETYVNGKLNSSICEEGRKIVAQGAKGVVNPDILKLPDSK
jgi:hypothetical protein